MNTTSIKRFEVGKTYSMRSTCDYECVWTYKVTARTACTITLMGRGGEIKCRINKQLTEWSNVESVLPLGKYSMSPILRADNN